MTDHALQIRVELRSPLLLGTDRDYSLFLETRDYVPGGVLRGSLARLLDEAQAKEDFAALFGPDTAAPIFENLHPSWSESFTYPLPLSARTCKHHSGFTSQGKAHHGIGDILIRQAVFEDVLGDRDAKLPMLYAPRCPHCKGEVVPPKIQFYETTAGTFRPVSVPVRRFSRTAIGRRRYTAADQLLYTLETIAPGRMEEGGHTPLFFRGAVHCQASQKDILERWLPRVEWIGHGRSRGLGQIELQFVEDPFEGLPPLRDRLDACDEAVRKEWGFYKRVAQTTPPAQDIHFFSLDLLGPAVFTRCGLPATRPDLVDLKLDSDSASIYRVFTDHQIVGGWHMGAGLPRRTTLTTVMGSVYMIKTRGLSLEELADRLGSIEIVGLGEERGRGFGRILISSPFHYQPEVTL
jgi:CRISPR-associated protein Csx10